MKKVGFIGAFDKIDLILNLGKIISEMKNKVLIVDSTSLQKARYIVPAISPTTSYITDFEDMDVAVGFKDIGQIKLYLGIDGNGELPYDVVLVDADSAERIEEFGLKKADKNYFVTAFDLYSLKKGLEIVREVKEPMKLTKILFAKEVLKEDNDYLNFLSLGFKIEWEEDRIYFRIENRDLSIIAENQRVAKIKFRRLSAQYKDSLVYIILQILDTNESNVRRVVKNIEKGV